MLRPSLFALCLVLASCHNSTVTTLEGQAISCGEAQVASLAAALVPSVENVLTGQSPTWNADLDALVAGLGAAAACSINAAVTDLEQSVAASPKMRAELPPPALANGRAYMATKGWKFVK